MEPDPRTCTPGTPGVCHLDATCTPVTPYVCSSTRPMSYRCECNQGYIGDGLNCKNEIKLAHLIPLWFWGCSRCTIWPLLGSASAWALGYLALKLFSKNSNLCAHGTQSSQTDGQTACNLISALCVASRGKNWDRPTFTTLPLLKHAESRLIKGKLQPITRMDMSWLSALNECKELMTEFWTFVFVR